MGKKKKLKLKKTFKNARRWTLSWTVAVAKSLLVKLYKTEIDSKDWYVLKMKKEMTHMKKHIVLMEMLIDRYDKTDVK